jgi:acyl-CoA reductase-like NAD-dependent aldehyde dehydrogenase
MATFEVISPVDGSVYAERTFANDATIERVLTEAKVAQQKWKNTSIEVRAAICTRMVEKFVAQADEMGQELTWLMGRPIIYTANEIKRGFSERALQMIKTAAKALTDVSAPEAIDFQRFIRREPLGTVLVVAPWNYPYLTSVNVVIPAIMAGNTVILKHAQQTPHCAERYAAAFEESGLPTGVFQYIHTTHEGVARIVADKRIDFVAFTGSVAGGAAIQKAASTRFIATGLELGGKDPAYVRHDAPLQFAIENLVDGAMFNSGQSCCGIERIYVHERVYDEFVHGFEALTKQYVLGNPLNNTTTLGPMVRTSAANFVRNQITEAQQQGAKALIDASLFTYNQNNSPYLAPQVLVNVNHRMRIMTEETFGPAVGIMKVRSDEEAIKLMNDSDYGLTASIWTSDTEAALQIGDKIDTGTWFMNRCDYLDPALAWTGIKNSGRGCTLSSLGYESLTRPKSFHLRVSGF